jgi:hypothetical protein
VNIIGEDTCFHGWVFSHETFDLFYSRGEDGDTDSVASAGERENNREYSRRAELKIASPLLPNDFFRAVAVPVGPGLKNTIV